MRHYTLLDKLIIEHQASVETCYGRPQSQRPHPDHDILESDLNEQEKQESIALMRVNYTGEICAQALYRSQMISSYSDRLKAIFQTAAVEETDHLAWCQTRIEMLGGRTSYLNPLWYKLSFGTGLIAGSLGDAWSLGFMMETEQQVEQHLIKHLQRLPIQDKKSRAIVMQMQLDEKQHGETAKHQGAKPLPFIIKQLMTIQAKIMTHLTCWL